MSDCAICLNRLDAASPSTLTETSCGHTYHQTCLKTWLNVQTTCPCCRTTLRQPSLITSIDVEYDDICEFYYDQVEYDYDQVDDYEDLTDSDLESNE
jgi:hypothetical protein